MFLIIFSLALSLFLNVISIYSSLRPFFCSLSLYLFASSQPQALPSNAWASYLMKHWMTRNGRDSRLRDIQLGGHIGILLCEMAPTHAACDMRWCHYGHEHSE